LLVVAIGWRPRITGLFHWYIAASLFASALMADGGDQITVVLAFLLVPVTMTDPRRWHWEAPVRATPVAGSGLLSTRAASAQILALSCFMMIRLQMAGVYLQAATSKMRVPEWRDGTAVYYYFTHPSFGLADPVKSWAMPLLANGIVVTGLTWGAVLLEIFLFAGLIAERRYRRVLLRLGIAFHAMIALVHGLLSFTLAMWAGLMLFLHPVDEEFAALRVWGGKMMAPVKRSLFLLVIQKSPPTERAKNMSR
jgi:antimicrobial peptide system SdpB family protein